MSAKLLKSLTVYWNIAAGGEVVLKRIGRSSRVFMAIVKVELRLSDRFIGTAKWGFEIFFGWLMCGGVDSRVQTWLIVVTPERAFRKIDYIPIDGHNQHDTGRSRLHYKSTEATIQDLLHPMAHPAEVVEGTSDSQDMAASNGEYFGSSSSFEATSTS